MIGCYLKVVYLDKERDVSHIGTKRSLSQAAGNIRHGFGMGFKQWLSLLLVGINSQGVVVQSSKGSRSVEAKKRKA